MTGEMSVGAPSRLKTAARIALGAALLFTGTSHLTWARTEFLAQVPRWLPLRADVVVIASGVLELALGAALVFARRQRSRVGWAAALFLVAIFPGNVSQYSHGIDAFGLNSDMARFLRLFFQPVLVAFALWSTDAWATFRASGRGA